MHLALFLSVLWVVFLFFFWALPRLQALWREFGGGFCGLFVFALSLLLNIVFCKRADNNNHVDLMSTSVGHEELVSCVVFHVGVRVRQSLVVFPLKLGLCVALTSVFCLFSLGDFYES